MAKRRNYRRYARRARGFLNFGTLVKFIKIGAFAAPAIDIYQENGGGLRGASTALAAYGGYNMTTKAFDFGVMARAWTPYVMTTLVTTGISKLNGIIKRL